MFVDQLERTIVDTDPVEFDLSEWTHWTTDLLTSATITQVGTTPTTLTPSGSTTVNSTTKRAQRSFSGWAAGTYRFLCDAVAASGRHTGGYAEWEVFDQTDEI